MLCSINENQQFALLLLPSEGGKTHTLDTGKLFYWVWSPDSRRILDFDWSGGGKHSHRDSTQSGSELLAVLSGTQSPFLFSVNLSLFSTSISDRIPFGHQTVHASSHCLRFASIPVVAVITFIL